MKSFKQNERPSVGKRIAKHRRQPVAKQRIMPIRYRRLFGVASSIAEEQFRSKIAKRLGGNVFIIPIGRARAGIYLLTKLAMLGGRRKVLLSPFTIPDVVKMVILAGAVPVFFDFEADTTTCKLDELKAQVDDDTACVLVTHYHVNELHLAEIAALCRSRGAYLFDDCAISFGGSIEGRPVGTLTDASVFSLSAFKLLNFFWGGMITTRDARIASFLEGYIAKWPRLSFLDYVAPGALCLKYDLASSPLLFGWLVFPLLRRRLQTSPAARGLEHVRAVSDALDPTLTSRPSLSAFSEWVEKLDGIDQWLIHRRSIASIYHQSLGHVMVSSNTPEAMLDGACFVNFPVLVPHQRRAEICRAMMMSGFDVGLSLYPNSHRHPQFITVAGHSENVDRLVASTIYLPTHFGVSHAYAEQIVAWLVAEIGLGHIPTDHGKKEGVPTLITRRLNSVP